MEMFKQATSGYSPEQMNAFFDKAQQMGIPSDYIKQVKDGIKAQ